MKLILVVLALAAAPAVAFAPHTDPDLVTCYEFTLSSTTVTWGECATECEALDGFFPCIEDETQNDDAFAAFAGSGNAAWIDLHDTTIEGTWVCSSSLQIPTYFNWDSYGSEPNGGTGENCANMWGPFPGSFRNPGTWNDWSCGNSLPCICKTPTPCDA